MNKRELIQSVLERMGYQTKIDDDGDVHIRHELKHFYVIVGDEEDDFTTVCFPQFREIAEGEDVLALATCNKLNLMVRLAKTFVDASYKSITSNVEFNYKDEDALEHQLRKALKVLSMMRAAYQRYYKEIKESMQEN